jgi:hypothetical protein
MNSWSLEETKMTPAEYIEVNLPKIVGSLQIYGQWFGRPYDNVHRAVKVETAGNLVTIHFNEKETLEVWDSSMPAIEEREFIIAQASRVRWTWFSYGSPKEEAYRFFYDYIVERRFVRVDTNYVFVQTINADINQMALAIHR